jgi:hypothetical protein
MQMNRREVDSLRARERIEQSPHHHPCQRRDMAEKAKFPLVKLIRALGDQLREAQRQAAEDDQPDLLRLKECTVELGIEWEKTGEGGLEFWVVKLGAGVTKTDTQTLSVTMEPFDESIVMAVTE